MLFESDKFSFYYDIVILMFLEIQNYQFFINLKNISKFI